MQLEVKKHVADALTAIERALRFIAGKTLADYTADELLRAAVERQFVTVGEALVRLRQRSPSVLDRITDHRRIIRFRNIVVHGYDVLADETVWDILQAHAPGSGWSFRLCSTKTVDESGRVKSPRLYARRLRRKNTVSCR